MDVKNVDLLVESVRFFEGRRVEVELNYKEEKQIVERIIGEMEAGADE